MGEVTRRLSPGHASIELLLPCLFFAPLLLLLPFVASPFCAYLRGERGGENRRRRRRRKAFSPSCKQASLFREYSMHGKGKDMRAPSSSSSSSSSSSFSFPSYSVVMSMSRYSSDGASRVGRESPKMC